MTGWGTPREVGLYVGRSVHTVRNWAHTLRVPAACELKTGRLVVHAATARRLSDDTPTRERRAA